MKQKKMLVLTFSQLKQIYTQEMPELVEMAAVSPTVEDFKAGLLKHLDSCGMVNEVAEWGSMMSDTRNLLTTHPWVTFAPGIAIFLSVMVFNLLGDTVRDLLDPRNER